MNTLHFLYLVAVFRHAEEEEPLFFTATAPDRITAEGYIRGHLESLPEFPKPRTILAMRAPEELVANLKLGFARLTLHNTNSKTADRSNIIRVEVINHHLVRSA